MGQFKRNFNSKNSGSERKSQGHRGSSDGAPRRRFDSSKSNSTLFSSDRFQSDEGNSSKRTTPKGNYSRFTSDRPQRSESSSDRPRYSSDRPQRSDRFSRDRNSRTSNFGGGRGRGSRGGRRSRYNKPDNSTPIEKYIASVNIVEIEQKPQVNRIFKDYNLESALLRNLEEKGYEVPTPIQDDVIPVALQGKNVLGISATGSGKTGAFLIPLINKLIKDRFDRAVILAPTRELAIQIEKEISTLTPKTDIRYTRVIGGERMDRQKFFLSKKPQIVIATPGRLIDMFDQKAIHLSDYNHLVLDEVDRMLDMGFIKDVEFIIDSVKPKSQKLFFSATLDKKTQSVIDNLGEYHLVQKDSFKPVDSVEQTVELFLEREDKINLLHDILAKEDNHKTIIFMETKREVDKIEEVLRRRGFRVGALHGDKSQYKRKSIIQDFTRSRFRILLATNVAARGIDIDDITHVINYDEPQTYDEYIHRIGRTGRNGRLGKAITFVHKDRTKKESRY